MSFELSYDAVLVATAQAFAEFQWEQLVAVTLVRDSQGHFSAAVSSPEAISAPKWQALEQHTSALLRGRGGAARRLWREEELLAPDDIVRSIDRVKLTSLSTGQVEIYLVDRLFSNQDWLRPPISIPSPDSPKLAVAYSIKGGVGRTLAFSVLAWYLARKGLNVALLDLDLEAPGAGSTLLSANVIPDYGITDWLYARLADSVAPGLDDCFGAAGVAQDAEGRVQVFPAYGRKSREYISKLGRIYSPSLTSERNREGFAERMLAFITAIGTELHPDVILLDSRAGLDDIGAAAVTRLGAEAFLFSRNDAQSWDGYRQLFAHLSHSPAIQYGMPDDDLRWRMKMVLAQADASEEQQRLAIRTSFEVWTTLYDEVEPGAEVQPEQIQLSELEESAPHFPLFIPFQSEIRGWRLDCIEERPSFETVQRSFGAFCDALYQHLGFVQ